MVYVEGCRGQTWGARVSDEEREPRPSSRLRPGKPSGKVADRADPASGDMRRADRHWARSSG